MLRILSDFFSYLTDRFHLNRADSHGFEALAQPYFRTV